MSRYARESLHPADYLASSYYEIWTKGLEKLLVQQGLVRPEELKAGRALTPSAPVQRVLRAEDVPGVLARGGPAERPAEQPARYAVGDGVVTRNMHPGGHTRLPRYARAKCGVIERVNGVFVFPDANAHGRGESPQWLYTVRFAGTELWGEDADPALAVSVTPGRAILSRPEGLARAAAAVAPIPRGDDGGPVFAAPWEAQAFAMTLALYERGVFAWSEWAAALAREIKIAQQGGDQDSGSTYYRHWLAALERSRRERHRCRGRFGGAAGRLGSRRPRHPPRAANRALIERNARSAAPTEIAQARSAGLGCAYWHLSAEAPPSSHSAPRPRSPVPLRAHRRPSPCLMLRPNWTFG